MGRTMQSITHPDDLPRNQNMFARAVAEGTPYTHEKRYIRKDGGIVWVNNSVSVIRRNCEWSAKATWQGDMATMP